MKKLLLFSIFFISCNIFANTSQKIVNDKITKFNNYKILTENNRNNEIRKNTPTQEELNFLYTQNQIQLEKEMVEHQKYMDNERLKLERQRNNIINSILIGGAGYGIYRVGEHHHWW